MTDLCTLLDSYLDGMLSDDQSERFESHAATCETCASALAVSDDLGELVSSLADAPCPPDVLASALAATESEWPDSWSRAARDLSATTCPPAVLDKALRQTRRAPDRVPTHRSRRTVTRWAVGLAAFLVLALAWSLRPTAEPTTPQIAEVVPPPAADSRPASTDDSTSAPVQAAPEAETVGAEAAPDEDLAPSPPIEPEPPDALPHDRTLEPIAAAQDTTRTPPADVAEPSEEAIEAARDDLALAFALIDDAQFQARTQVRDQAGPISTTLDLTLPF